MLPFTQHALERYMKRAKVRDVQKACEALWELPEKVTPVDEEIFLHNDEVIIIKNEVIQTYYKINKWKKSRLICAKNLRRLAGAF
jgi:hypothetical protein